MLSKTWLKTFAFPANDLATSIVSVFHIVLGAALCLVLLTGCTKSAPAPQSGRSAQPPRAPQTETMPASHQSATSLPLPAKPQPESMRMSESPITAANIDGYLFLPDTLYIDLRSPEAFYTEGHIAGFVNVPFYGYLADFPKNRAALFRMEKPQGANGEKGGAYPGDKGSFAANYAESAEWIYETFDKKKTIVAISTAGVESCYFLNLLAQLGYDGAKLYNAGCFTNGMGNDVAYRTLKTARHLVPPFELHDTRRVFELTGLTPLTAE